MASMNRVFLFGHLGTDPELRSTPSGTAVVKLALATTSSKKVNDEWVESTDWHRVTVFGKQAEWLARSAHKGSFVGVEATLRQNKWVNKEGQTQYGVDLLVDRVVCNIPPKKLVQPDVDGPPPASGPRAPDPAEAEGDAIPF